MKPHLRKREGLWWCGDLLTGERSDYYLWACCAPTVREVCDLWARLRHVKWEAQ